MKIKKYTALVLSVLTLMMTFMPAAMAGYKNFDGFPQKQEGDTGGYVRALQTVVKYNHQSSLANDGQFGSLTTAAVESFQHDNALTCDGIVGTNTWAKMFSKLHVSGASNGTTYYNVRKPGTAISYTNTNFFKFVDEGANGYRWFVYKAASGNDLGTWYLFSLTYPTSK